MKTLWFTDMKVRIYGKVSRFCLGEEYEGLTVGMKVWTFWKFCV